MQLTPKQVIHCETYEQAEQILNIIYNLKLLKEDVRKQLKYWEKFKETTYFRISEDKRFVYGSVNWVSKETEIIKAEDFIKNNNEI